MIPARKSSSVSVQLARSHPVPSHGHLQKPRHSDSEEVIKLRREVESLNSRLINMEQSTAKVVRDCAAARHLSAMFEEYVLQMTQESAAMLKTQEALKSQGHVSDT